jgi:predicted NUDIX family phosphoesterase
VNNGAIPRGVEKTSDSREVLVLPRTNFQDFDRFVMWDDAVSIMPHMTESVIWLSRDKAERSIDWVQPIPCALLYNQTQGYYVFRRVRKTRKDLSARISLVAGGHVDKPAGCESIHSVVLTSLLLKTLRRELEEELGIYDVQDPRLLGLVIDSSSIVASRHIAFVYEVVIDQHFKSQAPEEFSRNSKVAERFFAPAELSKFHEDFDPWSLVLFEDYIAPSNTPSYSRRKTQQMPLPFL